MAIAATTTIDDFVGEDLTAKKILETVIGYVSDTKSKTKDKINLYLIELKKYFGKLPNLVNNQQTDLPQGINRVYQNGKGPVSTMMQYLQPAFADQGSRYGLHNLIFTLKSRLKKILYQKATKMIRSPAPKLRYSRGYGEE